MLIEHYQIFLATDVSHSWYKVSITVWRMHDLLMLSHTIRISVIPGRFILFYRFFCSNIGTCFKEAKIKQI